MPGQEEQQTTTPTMPITGVVPMIPVLDIERSLAFYKLLGYAVGNRQPREGRMGWAWLYSPAAPDWRRGPNLMLTRSDHPIEPAGRAVLFYHYATDLPALREQLLASGKDPGPITYPEYLPKGELAIHDPDGYRIMLAQNAADTP